MSQRIFRIHPSIGVARVGNSPTEFFIGPERPNEPPNYDAAQKKFRPFKDSQGRLKRQAARFRLFEYELQGNKRVPVREVTIGANDIVRINWKVHLANRKAAFFIFNAQDGADGRWQGKLIKNGHGVTLAGPRKLRNQGERDRNKLVIDPGLKSIWGPNKGGVVFNNPNTHTSAIVKSLGELRTDERGNLLVLGGHGESGSTDAGSRIINYVNNENWFDGMGDGPVTAEVTYKVNGVEQTVLVQGKDAAWVMMGPPDFAPAVDNIVRLLDTMWDVAVRENVPLPEDEGYFDQGLMARLKAQKKDWDRQTNSFKTYKPSFLHEVYPLLQRALLQRQVHNPEASKSYHGSFAGMEPDLGSVSSSPGRRLRRTIFGYMRNPDTNTGAEPLLMPKAMGDRYSDTEPPGKDFFMSLTRVQYAVLARWAAGEFAEDWNEAASKAIPQALTPEGLDRASLENAVGGPFFPGIDCSWLVRRPELYALPFRMNHSGRAFPGVPIEAGIDPHILDIRAGFFSQQMALPWQADFYECRKGLFEPEDGSEAMYHMWWCAHRPDDVFAKKGDLGMVPWTRVLEGAATKDAPNHEALSKKMEPLTPEEKTVMFEVAPETVAMFIQMQQNWPSLGFVVQEGEHFFETQEMDTAGTVSPPLARPQG